MSHYIYCTEAIILGSTPVGESNKLLFFLTEDFGFVVAIAQGIRELKSKLRYSLQDFGVSNINMVRGKDMWRVVNAEPLNGYHALLHDREKIILLARIFSLLRRLLHGEERNRPLYETLRQILYFLEQSNLSAESMRDAEIVANLKILHHLGYGSSRKDLHALIHMPPSKDLLALAASARSSAIAEINKSLRASHL